MHDVEIPGFCWDYVALCEAMNLQGKGETEARRGFLGQRVRREPQVPLEWREREGS